MPRSIQTRRISSGLEERVFKPRGRPIGQLREIALSLDELEALRLADREGLYQAEAAERMGVSRATFARIVTSARSKVAEALVEGHALSIRGGEITRSRCRRSPCPLHGSGPRKGRSCRCSRAL